jgi:hypothetical protein
MLVIVAIVSTFVAASLIRWLMKGQERTGPALGEPAPADVAAHGGRWG